MPVSLADRNGWDFKELANVNKPMRSELSEWGGGGG